MKQKLIIILVLLVNFTYKAQQNLVPNGSFELYDTCPQYPNQLYRSKYWFKPTLGSSDFFSSCSNFNIVGMPINSFGFQMAQDGNSYAGAGFFSGFYSDYKEYLSVKLSYKLKFGSKYKFTCYLSLADSAYLCSNKLAILFSNDSLTNFKNLSTTIPLISSLNINCNNCFYEDKTNWMKLEADYESKGDESFITIGSFDDYKLQTNKLLKKTNNFSDSVSVFNYLFIDNITLYQTDIDTSKANIVNEIITANSDGKNDFFAIKIPHYIKCKYQIFNRWGNEVHSGDIQNIDDSILGLWDGKYKGQLMPSGTYYYLIQLVNKKNEVEIKKGFIHLIN
ncbi:MAG: gliding motility-associated C-terminal domain-containing protein [Bacteroidota bacterium]